MVEVKGLRVASLECLGFFGVFWGSGVFRGFGVFGSYG